MTTRLKSLLSCPSRKKLLISVLDHQKSAWISTGDAYYGRIPRVLEDSALVLPL